MVWLSNDVFPHVRLLCNFLEQKGVKRACTVSMAMRRSLSDDSVGLDSSPTPAGQKLPAILDASPLPIVAPAMQEQPDNGPVTAAPPILAVRSEDPNNKAMIGFSGAPAGPSGIDSVIAQCLEVLGGTRAPVNKADAKSKAKAKAKVKSASATPPTAKAKGKTTAKAKAKAKAKAAVDRNAGATATTTAHVKSRSTAGLPTKVQLLGGKWVMLGCPKCRGSPVGCWQCRNPQYSGNRWTRNT